MTEGFMADGGNRLWETETPELSSMQILRKTLDPHRTAMCNKMCFQEGSVTPKTAIIRLKQKRHGVNGKRTRG